jgi:hypothetical protein
MRALFFFILLLTVLSCTSKKYTSKQLLPKGIKSATEETFVWVNNQKKLAHKKQMIFTRNGRIKHSKTIDSLGNILQETQKRLWFIVESYPDREPYYCKTRWKPKQRERISCYTQKQHKQNEVVYHYNKDGSIAKIVDHFPPYQTQYFYYTDKQRSKIVILDKNEKLVDEILVSCATKDEKGACLKEIRISTNKNYKEVKIFHPIYR